MENLLVLKVLRIIAFKIVPDVLSELMRCVLVLWPGPENHELCKVYYFFLKYVVFLYTMYGCMK